MMRSEKETTARAAGVGGKFFTFFLAAEEYGIEILKVQEIIGMLAVTPVPRTPAYIRGVVNLRGKIIPILDLRRKLSMPEAAATAETCIVVVRARDLEMGVVVDRVSEVAEIAAADVQASPRFGDGVNTEYILGIGKSEGRVRLLLDIDKVLSSQDVIDLRAAGAAHDTHTKGSDRS